MVFGAFLIISATETLYENLHSHQKIVCSALLAMENTWTCDILRTADTKLVRQIKHMTFAKQNWKPATFALRVMILGSVRLANYLTTAVLTSSTTPCAFLSLCATAGICWGLSDFHEEKLLIAGSNKISRKAWLLKNSSNRGVPCVVLETTPKPSQKSLSLWKCSHTLIIIHVEHVSPHPFYKSKKLRHKG